MNKTILTTDDSKVIRLMLKNALTPLGVTVAEAACGQEAVEFLNKQKPDLVILDVTMPDMSGIEVLKYIRHQSQHSEVPVVMLTAESDDETVEKANQLGVSGYVAKPFTMERVIEVVSELLGNTIAR